MDEYCVLFDAEEDGGAGGKESQFVHTKVHELFKDLVSGCLLMVWRQIQV